MVYGTSLAPFSASFNNVRRPFAVTMLDCLTLAWSIVCFDTKVTFHLDSIYSVKSEFLLCSIKIKFLTILRTRRLTSSPNTMSSKCVNSFWRWSSGFRQTICSNRTRRASWCSPSSCSNMRMKTMFWKVSHLRGETVQCEVYKIQHKL